jgi:hypothetical protein
MLKKNHNLVKIKIIVTYIEVKILLIKQTQNLQVMKTFFSVNPQFIEY